MVLELRSCLHDAVNKDEPHIGKIINKHELYRQCLPRRMKNTIMNKIKNASYVLSVTTLTPLLKNKEISGVQT